MHPCMSEISGNVIDLCPVGALTSLPYASKGRPWELRVTESIDVSDSLHANIYVNFKETQVMRVLPKNNNEINDSLISDRARYTYDANSLNRIIAVSGPSSVNENRLVNLGWKKALPKFDTFFRSNALTFLIDENVDFESLIALRKLNFLYPNKFFVSALNSNKNGNFYFNINNNVNTLINNVDSLILFLGTNPKIENAILNTKIRIKAKNNLVKLYSFGLSFDYNYLNNFINLNTFQMFALLNGNFSNFCISVVNSSNSLILVGESLKNRISNLQNLKKLLMTYIPTAFIVFFGLKANSEGLNLFKFKQASFVNTTLNNNINFFVKTEDNINTRKIFTKHLNKNIWYNTHGSELSKKANFVLPATSHFEKEQIYINLENRPQKTLKVLEISKGCKNLISLLLSLYPSVPSIPISNFKGSFEYIQEITEDSFKFENLTLNKKSFANNLFFLISFNKIKISKYPLTQKLKNFYSADTFSRNSIIMQNCSRELKISFSNF